MHNSTAPADTLKSFAKDPGPVPLDCDVQPYDWGQAGDQAYIPRLLGRAPEKGKTYAELWIGDHPVKPARALLPGGETGLPALIQAAPEAVLGAASRKRFGDRLPFLMKVLAAAKALSIQAHPTKKQAEEGFAREEAAGVPRGAPHRNYKDDNHKPELLVALTPFWGLNRFRALEEIADALEKEAPELKPLAPDFRQRLSKAASAGARRDLLKSLYEKCMSLPQGEVNALLGPLVQRLAGAGSHPESRREYWVLRADKDYSRGPDKDRGLFSLYLLNLVRLEPGQGMFLDAGELHAYLEGVGVEVMANSDNVLRGGLTPKHIDIPELMRTLTFGSGPAEVLSPGSDGLYRTPAPEFEVAAARLQAGGSLSRPAERGVDVWLATEGGAALEAGGKKTPLAAGKPVLVPRALGGYRVSSAGGAVLYRSSVPMSG